jgi:hypothetical protein
MCLYQPQDYTDDYNITLLFSDLLSTLHFQFCKKRGYEKKKKKKLEQCNCAELPNVFEQSEV